MSDKVIHTLTLPIQQLMQQCSETILISSDHALVDWNINGMD